jgi:hypothetical protein
LKTRLLLVMAMLLSCCSPAVRAQNIEGQIIAAQYGKWRVPAVPQPTTGNAFSFVAAACTQIAGNASFQAFQVGTPIEIFDANPALNEVVTPSAVSATNQGCSITVTPVNVHHSFSLGSATGGLQEALNANLPSTQANMIVLTKAWYDQGGTSAIITSTVQGSTLLNLVDDTKSPYDWYQWNGSHYAKVSIGGGNPGSPALSLQFANSGATGFQGSTQLLYDPTTDTLTDKANVVINALSSVPRAVYDPMDTQYLGGLAAAIAGSSGSTPSQVLQKVADYGECQILMGLTQYHAVSIPLPSGITINIGQVLLWGDEAIGGDGPTTGPTLQHNDSTKYMIAHHNAGDTITCSNGTTYNPQPSGAGGTYIHDLVISGMGPVNTDTDIGILMNCASCLVTNIRGTGNAFGSPTVMSNGTSVFMYNIGQPGSQVKGCATYNGGIRPVSGFTLGGQVCGSVQDQSGDGGDDNIYATDGQAFNPGHAPGSCYPSCAAMVISGNGEDANRLFLQVSSQGLIVGGSSQKIHKVRIDFTSREAIREVSGGATATLVDTVVDSACTDTSLLTNYLAGVATGCFSTTVPNGSRLVMDGYAVQNNVGIFAQAKVQAWVNDQNNSGAGVSSQYLFGSYQGSADNTTANDLLMVENGASKISPMVYFPDRNVEAASNTTPNVSGITSITLVSSQTVTNFKNGINGQHLYVQGAGIVQNNANIQNQNGLDNTVTTANSYSPLLEYVYANGLWRQIAGPANQTPTHVNYSGNPTPAAPSLIEVYGNIQPRPAPAFSILAAMQLHGPAAGAGQACFEQLATYPDGSFSVSDLQCTTVNLTTQTPGEIFTATVPQAVLDLYLVSNTEGNGVAIGKYPRTPSLWDGPTTIAAGGDGTTAPTAGRTNTGQVWSPVTLVVGTKFTTSGCAISSTAGGATAGTFTLGANSCTAVVTFNGAAGTAALNGWTCQAHDRTAPTVLIGGESTSTITTASIPIPAGAGATDVISFRCVAY